MSGGSWQWLESELAQLDQLGLRRQRGVRRGPQSVELEWNGRRVINFGSNDYLGLAAGTLTGAVQAAILSTGWGSGASPLVTGRGARQQQLESELADFEQAPAALVFPTGFAANLGTVAALAGRGDVIFSDSKNHASLIDGCRLSGARIQVYPHLHCEHLEKYLAQTGGFRRRLIVTESLFSMDGDLAPLDTIANLAERYDAMLVVDEAHATGVFGVHGRGLCEHFGVEPRVTARIGTFSKALGSLGGFVVGPEPVIEWLVNRARPYVFSTAPPEAFAAAALAALQVVRHEPARRMMLLSRAAELRRRLAVQGWPVLDSPSQIIPLLVGSPDRAMSLAARLLEQGLLVPGIRPPTVPDGESMLRISLSYDHTMEMIDRLIAALAAELRGR